MPPEVSSSEAFRRPCCEKYIRTKFSFFICFGDAGLTLALAGTLIETLVAAAETGAKDLGRGDVGVSERVTGSRSSSA
jgi:hypothetical protein